MKRYAVYYKKEGETRLDEADFRKKHRKGQVRRADYVKVIRTKFFEDRPYDGLDGLGHRVLTAKDLACSRRIRRDLRKNGIVLGPAPLL